MYPTTDMGIKNMAAPRLIEKRLLWATVLGLVVHIGIIAWIIVTEGTLIGAGGYESFVVSQTILFLTIFAVSYSLMSLINVGRCLVKENGIHNDAVGVIGGIVLAAGFQFTLAATAPILFELERPFPIEIVMIATVLTLVGMVLVVKG